MTPKKAAALALPPLPKAFLQRSKWILFVRNIDPTIDVHSVLMPLLETYGQCHEMILTTDPFGMLLAAVSYKEPEQLANTLHLLNGALIGGRWITAMTRLVPVNVPMRSRSYELYLTNFSEWISEEMLYALCRPYGRIIRLKLDRSVYGYRYAIVSFSIPYERDRARAALHRHNLGDGYSLEVTHPPAYPGPCHGPVSPTEFRRLLAARSARYYVRVSGLSSTVCSKALGLMFRHFGVLLDFFLLQGGDQRPLGFAVARYMLRDEARKAAIGMNGEVVEGHVLHVEMVLPCVKRFLMLGECRVQWSVQ